MLFLAPATIQAEVPALDAEGYFQFGNQMLEGGKWEKSIPLYQSALSMNPNHCGAHMNMGCALALNGQYEQAIAELQKALPLEAKPFTAFVFFDIGGIHLQRALLAASRKEDPHGHFEQAAGYFARAVEVLPSFDHAIDLARFCTHPADFPGAFLSVDGASLPPDTGRFLAGEKVTGANESTQFKFDSETPAPLYFYRSASTLLLAGRGELRRGFVENATGLGQQALERIEADSGKPLDRLTQWTVLLWLSSVVSLNESWDQALDYVDKAGNLGVNPVFVEQARLNILLGKGDYTTARTIAQTILAGNPEDPLALHVLGFQSKSPRVGADGYYEVPEQRLRIKKPTDWFVFDRETNAKAFDELIKNFTSKESVLCVFRGSLAPFSPMLIFRTEAFPEEVSQEKYMAWMGLALQRSLSYRGGILLEKPTQVKLNNMSLIRYRMERVDDLSELPYIDVSWTHLGRRTSLQIEGYVYKHQWDRYLPVIEEVVKDLDFSVAKEAIAD